MPNGSQIAWFLCPMKVKTMGVAPSTFDVRYCAMDDFTSQIYADSGYLFGNTKGVPALWAETEINGDAALVKVRASAATLSTIGNTAGFFRLPPFAFSDKLSTLSAAQKTAIVNTLLLPRFTQFEINAALGTGKWQDITLGQLLKFIVRKPRLTPRLDESTGKYVADGAPVSPTPVEHAEAAVQ